MFDVRIHNGSLPKELKKAVHFPNWQKISGDAPRVSMITLETGEVLLDINDIIYAINDYENGRKGNNYIHVRTIVKSCFGFGTVVFFRRGGVYADITATQSILRNLLDNDHRAAKHRQIAHPSVYKALMDCPTNLFADLATDPDTWVPSSSLVAVVPSTIEVSKNAIVGVPVRSSDEPSHSDFVPDDAEATAEKCVQDATAGTAASTTTTTTTTPSDVLELPVADTVDPILTLIKQLAKGKQLVIRIGLE